MKKKIESTHHPGHWIDRWMDRMNLLVLQQEFNFGFQLLQMFLVDNKFGGINPDIIILIQIGQIR